MKFPWTAEQLKVALVAAGAWGVLLASSGISVRDTDAPWHVRTGELVREHGFLPPKVDPFSWTAFGEKWQPNGWGFDLLASYAFNGGWFGLAALQALLLSLVFAGLWVSTRGSNSWARVGALSVGVIFLLPFTGLRPQLLTFSLFILSFFLLIKALEGAWRHTVALLLAIALWSNIHGALLAGVGLLGLYLLGWWLTGDKTVARTLKVCALGVSMLAATLLNPYGLKLWSYAFVTRSDSAIVSEWRSFSIFYPRDVLILALGILVIVLTGKKLGFRRSLPLLMMLTGALILSLDAVRNQAFVALILPMTLAPLLSSASGRRWKVSPRKLLTVGVISALLALLAGNTEGLNPTKPSAQTFPVAAAKKIPTGCRIMNEYSFGGYLILMRPDMRVSQDGRNDLYGKDRINKQSLLLETGSQKDIEHEGVTCILSYPERKLGERLDTDWRMLHGDSLSEVWVKN